MKKLSILFVSLMAVLSLCAVTPAGNTLQLLPSSQATSTHQEATTHMLQRNHTKRQRPTDMQAPRIMPTPLQQRIPSLQQSATAPITLNGEGFLVGPEYEAASGEWYIATEAEGYTFRLCWYGPADTYCGTYTIDDISMEYTWGWYQSDDLFYEIYPTDINMTITEHQQGHLRQITLDATIVDTEDRTYDLHVVHNTFTPIQTIETTLSNTQLTVNTDAFTLDGNNDLMDIVLTINSKTIDGVYTHKNLDMTATHITYNGVQQQILQANIAIIGGNLPDGSLGYLTELSFFNQDTILHTVSMPASLPAPQDTITVSCTNMVVDDSFADFGIISVLGSNGLYDIIATYEDYVAMPGTYQDAYVLISDMKTWETVQAITSLLTLEETADGWHATIEAYATDYNWYSIDMRYIVPTPIDTVQVTFDSTAIATYRPDQSNMLQLMSFSDDFEAALTIYGTFPEDSFSMDNIVMDYCGIYNRQVQSSVAIADVNGQLHQYGDTTIISASVIGFDSVQYDLQLWYTAPKAIDTIEIEMPVEFINSMDYGYYTLAAYTPDSAWYISLSPVTDQVAGTFVNDGMFGKFGADDGQYDFYGGNTFVYSQAEWTNYTVEKGTLVVEATPDGQITAEANIICRNAVCFHIKMTSEYNTHLDYDEPSSEVDHTYTTLDQVFIEDKAAESGYIYLSITAADNSNQAAFFFYVEESDPDIIIPEGTYPIDYTAEYGTVQANPGVQGNGVWPSFYAELAEDGSLSIPLWLIVRGSVVVTKNDAGAVYMEVNAFNSYDVPVHIIYDGTITALEDITTQQPTATKFIRNGQLIIRRDNTEYNAQGAVVK